MFSPRLVATRRSCAATAAAHRTLSTIPTTTPVLNGLSSVLLFGPTLKLLFGALISLFGFEVVIVIPVFDSTLPEFDQEITFGFVSNMAIYVNRCEDPQGQRCVQVCRRLCVC